MSRLPGVALDTVWDRVPTQNRDVLAVQLGETIAALRQLPPPEIRYGVTRPPLGIPDTQWRP